METFRQLTRKLSSVYPDGEAIAMARWVMEDGFGLTMTDLMLDKDNDLSSVQRQELQIIADRLLRKEPIQYVLGSTWFCGLRIHVEPGVLIPRPETEELVAWVCADRPAEGRGKQKVLDVGTGSGCIALALASEGFAVEACDVSPEALRIARRNASDLSLEVGFFEKDILQDEVRECPSDPYDVIVSNPPYICQREAEEIESHVLDHEPHLALFVPDDDPLLFYRHIARYATTHLSPQGALYFEINRAYGEEVCEMLRQMGFRDVELRSDQFGNSRMVRALNLKTS